MKQFQHFLFSLTEIQAYKQLVSLERTTYLKSDKTAAEPVTLNIASSGPRYCGCTANCVEIVRIHQFVNLVFGEVFLDNITLLWTTHPRIVVVLQ